MGQIKIATTWWCLEADLTPEEIIQVSRRLGYDGIEMAPPEHWREVTDNGLAIASHRGHGTLEDGLNKADNHDRIEREILENLALAERWHVPTLICFSGNRNGLDDGLGIEITATGLQRVARAAESAGVTLALELLNSKVDHPDYQCDHTAWGVEVIAQVGSPAVKLLYDIYHMQIMEGDLIRTIRQKHEAFGHYHLAGNPGRHEPDATQEINAFPVFAAILETGFEGWLGMEYLPTVEPEISLRRARALLTERD